MTWLLAAPLLIPFAAAVATLLAPRVGVPPRLVSLIGSVLHLGAALALGERVLRDGVIAEGMGGWAPPVGIVLVADPFSALMLLAAAGLGLAVAVFALADIDPRREAAGWHALFQLLLAGASGAFLTGDLFNLYVWFEVMLIASFGMMTVGGSKAELDAGVKYVALNLVATVAFLAAIGLVHGVAGTLTLADLPGRIDAALAADPAVAPALGAAALLLLTALGAKAGLFPLFFWLPASYHAPSAATTAIFAGLLTKAGVYAMIRVFTLVFPEGPALDVLAPVAIATMVLGVIGAAAHKEVNRILAFHIVSQIGYVALGLALGSALALAGANLYLLHNIVVKANLILLAGVARRLTGSHHLSRAGGLYLVAPGLSALFVVAAFAMAGVPPLSGFWGKLALTRAGLEAGDWAAVAAVLGVGLFTLYSMTKIWLQGWLAPHPEGRTRPLAALPRGAQVAFVAPTAALTVVTLGLGLFPDMPFRAASAAAGALLDPAAYVAAVMGAPPETALAAAGGAAP